MDKEIRKIVYSDIHSINLELIFKYGTETFGVVAAKAFLEDLFLKTEKLKINYLFYLECRYLKTKSNLYNM
jgi:hypothetical protein